MDNLKIDYLKKISDDKAFKLSNGTVVYGLEQLLDEIKKSNETFYNHVNDSKNDFENWIRYAFEFQDLANNITNIKNREEFILFMDKMLMEIKNPGPTTIITEQAIETKPVAEEPNYNNNNESSKIISETKIINQIKEKETDNNNNIPTEPAINPIITDKTTSVEKMSEIKVPEITKTEENAINIPIASDNINQITELTFEFEEIFKALINELEKDIFEWDTTI